MICVICHGNEIEAREVSEDIRLGSDIVHVPVVTPVCGTCGERYYDRKTIRHLESVEQRLREGNGQLKEVGRILVYEQG